MFEATRTSTDIESRRRINFTLMDPTLDQVREELADIYEQLIDLPVDEYDRRAQLKERQHTLRQLSAALVQGEPLHDARVLMAAYKRLEELRDDQLDKLLVSASTSIGDAGIDSVFTSAINKAIATGLGTDEIEERLTEIIRQLRSSG
jgi:hypothetical protein